MDNRYDKDYFEHGEKTGVSLYRDYRWLPELTIPMAYTMIRYLNIKMEDEILDFGCAKGYLVYALRLLHHKAWGYDVSAYALENSQKEIREYLMSEWPNDKKFNWVIAKDVLEHIEYKDIVQLLTKIRQISDNIFCVIPLGDGKKYIVDSYENDVTHRIRENKQWWEDTFKQVGFNNIKSTTRVKNIKENYAQWEGGNLFLTASL